MTLTINTLDGKSIQAEVTLQEYQEYILAFIADDVLFIKIGDVEHMIRTKHIVSLRGVK